MIREVASNHRLDGAVESFCLPIRLGMIGCRERVVHVEYTTDVLEELISEVFTVVG